MQMCSNNFCWVTAPYALMNCGNGPLHLSLDIKTQHLLKSYMTCSFEPMMTCRGIPTSSTLDRDYDTPCQTREARSDYRSIFGSLRTGFPAILVRDVVLSVHHSRGRGVVVDRRGSGPSRRCLGCRAFRRNSWAPVSCSNILLKSCNVNAGCWRPSREMRKAPFIVRNWLVAL
jgi:hypothetical protein